MFVDNNLLADGRLSCTWSDITEVKRGERRLWDMTQDLRRSQDHLVTAQRIAHVGSLERDLRTGAATWTPEMYVIFGRDRRQPPPNRDEVLQLFHPDDRDRYQAIMQAAERGDSLAPGEFRIVRPDGSIRWVYHESEVVFDEDGRPALRVGTYRDVTEIHEYQDRQQRLQTELLSRERLSAIGTVTATVAHELRNPLSTIKNSIYSIKTDVTEGRAPGERLIARMERSIDRCNRILSDLLEYSRTTPLNRRPYVLDEWLREAVAGCPVPENISVVFDLGAAGAAAVELDSARMRRAISNLIENAVQAIAEMPEAGREPRIIVRSACGRDEVEIVIEDNGPGLEPEIAARAFEPLLSTKSFGTGLGLPTARQIVEQHGGAIELHNVSGGASAVMRLPIGIGFGLSCEIRRVAAA
jgi:signal transduction histidine kinase